MLAQLGTHAVGHADQHFIAHRMAEGVVDLLEVVAVEEKQRQVILLPFCIAHAAAQAPLEEGAVGQAGQAVVAGLVRQGLVFALQVALPHLQFVQQGVEVIAQFVELGNRRFRHAPVETALAAGGVGDTGQATQRADDIAEQTPRQVLGSQGAEHRAEQDAGQPAEQEQQQATPLANQLDAPDLLLLVRDRQVDRLIQQGGGHLRLQPREHTGIAALPMRQLLAFVVEDPGFGHFLGTGDQRQRLIGRSAVVKHHRRFHGVADRAGDQVQVVVGVDTQGEHAQQGQGYAGQAHGEQGDAEVATAQHRAQGRAHAALAGWLHGCTARRRDNCSTLG
ncbi:hypothetical protein D3C75_753320 [compost metagenome]